MKPPRRRPRRQSNRQRQAARRQRSRFTNQRPAPALTLPAEAAGVRELTGAVWVREAEGVRDMDASTPSAAAWFWPRGRAGVGA